VAAANPAVPKLDDVAAYCRERLGLPGFPDAPGAMNGLQVSNAGKVTRIGAAVDAGLDVFRQAAAREVDFLVVHHGLFWDQPRPWVGPVRDRLAVLLAHDIAVYSAHLPLDAHPEIGNNAVLARRLGLAPLRMFLPFQGRDIGLITSFGGPRASLRRRLDALFPRITAIEFGADSPATVAIVTGGGGSAIDPMIAEGADTLVTGELKESHYVAAQDARLNLYACGHCATETFGVCALAQELAERFSVPWEFLATDNPL
jgi:dinuclear metal center YbgI/SA1388 family protein